MGKRKWNSVIENYKIGTYVCREIISESEYYYFIKLENGINAAILKKSFDENIVQKRFFGNIEKQVFWFYISYIDNDNEHIQAKLVENKMSIYSAYKYLQKNNSIGDIVYSVPIIDNIEDDTFLVELAPGFTSLIKTRKNTYAKFQLIDVLITRFVELENKVNIYVKKLETKEDYNFAKCNAIINDNIKNPFIPPSTIERFREKIFNDNEYSNNEIVKIIKKKYFEAAKTNKCVFDKNGNINFDTGFRDKNHSLLVCGGNYNSNENRYILSFLGVSSDYARELINLFFYVNWNEKLPELAHLALGNEKWGFDSDRPYFILSQYIRYTFYKAYIDDLVLSTKDNKLFVFNTGLVDKYFSDIYACFEKTNHSKPTLTCFFTERDKNGSRIRKKTSVFPKPVKYIKSFDDIFFDTSIELKRNINLEHVEDRLIRFPVDVLVRECSVDAKIRELLIIYNKAEMSNKYRIKKEICNIIKNNPDLLRRIQYRLDTAVQNAILRCKWNYKTAIPVYFIDHNNVSMLLPLCLGDISTDKDDLALVVEKNQSDDGGVYYNGKTILTLDMAYIDARQISRPDSEWLTTEAIKGTTDESESDNDMDYDILS